MRFQVLDVKKKAECLILIGISDSLIIKSSGFYIALSLTQPLALNEFRRIFGIENDHIVRVEK